MQATQDQKQSLINRRLPVVTWGLVFLSVLLLLALARLQQLDPNIRREFEIREQNNIQSVRRLPAVRGIIYDRDNVPLAFNVLQYEVGISPNLVSNPERVAQQLGLQLGSDEFEIYQRIVDPDNPNWELIARPVSAEVGQAIADEDLLGVVINPLSRRAYPQERVGGALVGFIIEDNNNSTRGAMGIEASYNEQLAGRSFDQTISNIPIGVPLETRTDTQRGMDVILTIDRDIQFWVEYELERVVNEQNAEGGTIIVMDPRNGDVLAMASYPTFDPNTFSQVADDNILRVPAIADIYEPGSVMKVLTVAAALDTGTITPQWTYNDQGSIEVGGRFHVNWDRGSYGLMDTSQLLVNSLNVGAVSVALEMQPDLFYSSMNRFGLGQVTGVDLPGEQAGIMRIPGDNRWSEADFASNSYGQAISTTALQMTTAYAAIANDGLMYQPRLVREIRDGDEIIPAPPILRNRAVSTDTANAVTDMMVRVVEAGATFAQVPGYTVAGKTGTAQISTPTGYDPDDSIASFIGFLPADEPQLVIFVKIDRPDGYWGSQVAAPLFSDLAQRLVVLLGIPNDDIRRGLQAEGGVINEERR
jgi:cell division protein FtsI (penicillin-binding protein 3)